MRLRRTEVVVASVALVVCVAQARSPAVWAAIETESPGSDLTGDASTDAAHPPAPVPTTGNPLWAIPVSKLSATRDRPLFSASRRPRAPAAPAAPAPTPIVAAQPPAPETPPFTLVGTIIGENSRIAIFFDDALKTATGVKEGESDSGWILRSVDPRSAILDGSGHTVTLDLPVPSTPASPAPPVSAPPWRNSRVKPGR